MQIKNRFLEPSSFLEKHLLSLRISEGRNFLLKLELCNDLVNCQGKDILMIFFLSEATTALCSIVVCDNDNDNNLT